MGLDIFENEGTSEKGCIEIASLYTLDWGFKKIPFTFDTYVLVAKILQNGAKKFRYTKADFKNYRNLSNFRQAVESTNK